MKKSVICLALILALALPFGGAALAAEAEAAGTGGIVYDEAGVITGDYFSAKDLSGEWSEKKAVALSLTGSVTISEAGTYLLTGALQNGTVTVNVGSEDKVQLVLSNVSITSSSSAAILVENADKVFITLAEGTQNYLTSTGFDPASDVDAAIFSRDDLVLNGSGALTIVSANHAVVGKDDLKITGGVYSIDAKGRALDANDSVRIAGGDFTIVSGKDAIRAKHEEAEKGYVFIAGGTFRITVNGGSANGPAHTDGFGGSGGGSNGATAAADTDSTKGIKASSTLIIQDGQITVDSADDAIHSDGDVLIFGGTLNISSGDDGMHANNALIIYGGSVTVAKSYEGLEAAFLTVAGGNVSIRASDDGMNSSGGSDDNGWGNDMFANDGSLILISGGNLYVNSDGDGIDSNGDLTVTGGVVTVSGPTSSMNGALDKNGTATITGGTVIAAGASGMAENFGSGSTQPSALVNLRGNAGEIQVMDKDLNVVFSATVEKSFQTVVVSSPDLVVGKTYYVVIGSSYVSFTASIPTAGGSGGGRGW